MECVGLDAQAISGWKAWPSVLVSEQVVINFVPEFGWQWEVRSSCDDCRGLIMFAFDSKLFHLREEVERSCEHPGEFVYARS